MHAMHVKPIFTDVGKNCQDCHADITNGKWARTARSATRFSVGTMPFSKLKITKIASRFSALMPRCNARTAIGARQWANSRACRRPALPATCRTFRRPTNPNHVSAKFATTCDTCHSFDNWLGAKFDHSTTGFLLTNGMLMWPVPPATSTTIIT